MSVTEKRRHSLFPKTLGQCVEPLTRPVLKSQGLAGSRILNDWAAIVGPELARRSMPEKLSFPPGKKSGGTLVIATENGFATRLQHMQPMILERLVAYFGYPAISRLVISHSALAALKPELRATLKPPLSAAAVTLAGQSGDAELRDALLSLAKTLSGQI